MAARQVIPAQAVEAAARAMHDEFCRDPYDSGHIGPACYDYKNEARTALEAAAPHMLAEAFEQGQKSGMRHADRLVAAAKIGRPELPGPISPNPYRPTP